jgi:capsular exopolysaccharide synthesis family protein
MSQIFNALQKSEAERKGDRGKASLAVSELLREAESRFTATEVSTALEAESEVAVDGVPGAMLFEQVEGQPPSQGLAVSRERYPNQAADSLFEKLRTLPIQPEPQSRLVCLPGNESPAVEAFHLLGVRLRHLRKQRQLKRILITSTKPQEGKSVSAANLACTLARRAKHRTLLLEGDIRRPTQAQIFGIRPPQGLCSWLKGGVDLSECIFKLEGLDLHILPAGPEIVLAPDTLQSGNLSVLLNQLDALFDVIIIDSPPMLPLADTSLWKSLVDGVLLIVRQGVTEKRKLARGLEAIEPGKLIGALLNSSSPEDHDGYYYRSYQGTEFMGNAD